MYRRYRDDMFIVTLTCIDAKNIWRTLNNNPALKFNLEQSGHTVNFLDLTIHKGHKFKTTNKLDFALFTKPTKSPTLTHYTTYKPELTKTAWITGESIRILRASQTQRLFERELRQFKSKLLEVRYPKSVIRSRTRHKFADRKWLIDKQIQQETRWYSMQNIKHAHEAWNFIQITLTRY